MLDRRTGAAPLYAQLAALLDARIAHGELLPGDQLPSENELTAEFHVSRATVTKAFESLAARGAVIRVQGRGTFVRAQPMVRRLPELTGFSDHIRGLGLRPGQRLLSFRRLTAAVTGNVGTADTGDGPDARAVVGADLAAMYPPGTELVVVRRLRFVDGQPAGLQLSVLPAEVADAAGVTERALGEPDASLYALLDAAGVLLTGAHESLRAINAEPDDAALLATTPGAALIEVTRQSTDAAGRLVEVVQARYLGSLYVYRIDLARPTTAGEEIRPHDTHGSRSGHDGSTQGRGGSRRSIGLAARRGVQRQ